MTPAIVLLSLALGQAGGPTLTLDDAMRTAEQNNTDLLAARARLAQAHEISHKVWANYLPQITAGASYTRNNAKAEMAFPTTYLVHDMGTDATTGKPNLQGKPFDPSVKVGENNNWPGAQTNMRAFPDMDTALDLVLQKKDMLGAQVSATQGILLPALWPAIHSAYLAEDIAQYSVEAARREVLFGVAQLYYGVVGLKETVAVQEQLLENAKAHEADAKVCVQAGTMPSITLVRAQMDLTKADQDLTRARNAHASAKIALATLLNRDPNFDVQRPSETAIPAELTQGSADLADKAVRDRPDLRAAHTSLDLATTNDRWTWLNYLPNVVATGSYRIANVQGFTGQYDSWAVGLGLSWTLWDGGLREANWRENSAKLAEAQANLTGAQNKARAEVQQAMLDLESARANKTKAIEQTRLARENMQLVNVSFKAGTVTQLQVSDATSALSGAELGLIAESLNADLAALKLLKAAGAFDPK